MMTQAVSPRVLDELILVRLLVTGKGALRPGKLRDEVNRLRQAPVATEQLEEILRDLNEAGFLTRNPLRLTETGQTRALAFLGLEALPPRMNWGIVQSHYLVPRALGTETPVARKRLTVADNLRAAALRKVNELPIPETATLSRAVEATTCKLICEKFGLEPQANFAGVQIALLNLLLKPATPLAGKKLREQVPAFALEVTRGGMPGLREAILRHWLDQDADDSPSVPAPLPPAPVTASPSTDGTTTAPPLAEVDLATFAATVLAVARNSPAGRWGDNKVFINHVWRQLRQEPTFPPLSLDEFKARLTEANHQGMLRLERADLVQAMDANDVRESETTYLNATFHFVLLEGGRP